MSRKVVFGVEIVLARLLQRGAHGTRRQRRRTDEPSPLGLVFDVRRESGARLHLPGTARRRVIAAETIGARQGETNDGPIVHLEENGPSARLRLAAARGQRGRVSPRAACWSRFATARRARAGRQARSRGHLPRVTDARVWHLGNARHADSSRRPLWSARGEAWLAWRTQQRRLPSGRWRAVQRASAWRESERGSFGCRVRGRATRARAAGTPLGVSTVWVILGISGPAQQAAPCRDANAMWG